MPNDDKSVVAYPLLVHVQADTVSIHYLKLKLRRMIKADIDPDEMSVNVLLLLSQGLADAQAALHLNIGKFENSIRKVKCRNMQ